MNVKSEDEEKKEVKFTRREVEILQLIAKGYTGKKMAKKLFISEKTVDTHRTRLRQKTGCKNVASLAIYAFKNGFID